MSFLKRNQQFFAWAQQIGASTPHESQQDRIRMEFVQTKDGKKVLLAAIADGEHHPDAGNAAEYIVNHIFHQFRHQKGDNLNHQLAHALEVAGRLTEGKDGRVAATTIAIYQNRLYFAHVGHTAGFLVRDGKMIHLTQPTSYLLGMPSVEVQMGAVAGLGLQPGDRVLLATDSLLRISPEDGRPFVDPKDIPAHVEGNSPDDASRHLVSLAMGRDVDDNVTVAIIQVPGEKRPTIHLGKWIALLAAIPAIFALSRFIPSVQKDETPPQLTDYGYAVLVEGSALVETDSGDSIPAHRLEAVAPLSCIWTQETSRFVLQSNIQSSSALSSASIYLASESRVVFSLIDVGINLPEEIENLGNRSIFEITAGSIFVQRIVGSWVYQVDLGNESVSLTGTGRGAMGISISSSGIDVDCILGICEVMSGEDKGVVLQAGSSLSAAEGNLGEKETKPTQTVVRWNVLCGNCFED